MKKINEEGFTLVELLATITILGIIMLIAVPNVLGTVERNKKNTYMEDSKKLVSLAEYKMRSNTRLIKPTTGCGIIYTLGELDNGDLSNPPEGGVYDTEQSYVVITFSGGKYVYRVQLKENITKGANHVIRGIPLVDSTNINSDLIELQTNESKFTTRSNTLISNNSCKEES